MRNHIQQRTFPITRKPARKALDHDGIALFSATLAILVAFVVLVPAMGAEQSSSGAPAAVPLQSTAQWQVRQRPPGQGTGNIGRSTTSLQTKKNSVGKTPGSLSFLPAVSYYSGAYDAFSIAVADVNGDGKPDLLVANYCVASTNCTSGSVGVLLGNGDGTFQAAVTYLSGAPKTVSLAVADVNGDGRPDLLLANQCFSKTCSGGGVSVLLGNGNGTFSPAVTYSVGGGVGSSIAVADVNGDGRLDLVATSGSVVGVLLGKGDGTFQSVVTYPAGSPLAVAIADVNGDGKPDVLLADGPGAGVLLGNGDGTFQPEVTYSSGGSTPTSIAVADLNGDGKPDLLVMNFDSGNVGVLLGNGDGTFQPVTTYGGADGAGNPSVVAADVDGDGKLDLVVVNFCVDKSCDGGIGVFLGHGDGTFQPESVYLSGGYYAWALAVADVNGDGKPDLVVANLQLTNNRPLKGFAGVLLNNTVFANPTTTVLASSLNLAAVGRKVTYTATITSQSGTATGTVTFRDGGSIVGTVAVAGNQAAYNTSYKTDGARALAAIYSGDLHNAGSTSPTLMEYIGKFPVSSHTALKTSGSPSFVGQPVTFTSTVMPADSIYGMIPDGELVTFSDLTTTLASVALSGGTASYTTSSLSARTHIIKATYAGDAIFNSSYGLVTQLVDLYPTTTTLTSTPNPSTHGQAVTFTANVTSSGPLTPTGEVTFKDGTNAIGSATLTAAGVATLTNSTLKVGTHSITAAYGGDNASAKSTSAVLNQVVK